MFYVYILHCADGSYYVGSTSSLEHRLAEHAIGQRADYTRGRRPVELVWYQDFPTAHDAFLRERQIKGWSRAKKEALIAGDWARLHDVVAEERKRRNRKE